MQFSAFRKEHCQYKTLWNQVHEIYDLVMREPTTHRWDHINVASAVRAKNGQTGSLCSDKVALVQKRGNESFTVLRIPPTGQAASICAE